jgi:hypothetical protein
MIVASLLACIACASQSSIGQDSPDPVPAPEQKDASTLSVREAWIEKTEFVVMESAPPQFNVKLTVTMPTPNWKLAVDETVRKGDRIIMKVTATSPEGMVAQVLSSETFSANLGSLKAGEYLLEVHYRRHGEEAYRLRYTVMLSAAP